ncbi:MAG: hypothetical protein HON14_04925 [Rhodospirillaceae bacterium]|jgi:hypothetical protein|nr:hypothetical protein [Rhodospirillaceae bacterium]MBT4587998.1 hypothetical protein [Rhodospirillaceae bacterium]MBT4938455.1 hypothetical protein [Rhodospirillaceae bacterium]MBT7267085.1 hypothetical protein [Rhodospirillaceae bacterium]
MADPILKAIDVLNDALKRDPVALTQLVNLRVDCNAELVRHPTIQSADYHGVAKVGVLGLINGIIGNSPSGVIGAEGSIDRDTGQFTVIRKFVDLRNEKTDIIA